MTLFNSISKVLKILDNENFFDEVTQSVEILKKAQQEAEEIIISEK